MVDARKRCKACRERKLLEEFSAHPTTKDRKQPKCKVCSASWQRSWRYGVDDAEYERLLLRQGGRCALCGELPENGRSLNIDHDHETGLVRGLLCHHCNTAIGLFRESRELLQKADTYIAKARFWADFVLPGPQFTL
jgi:hypothetical protein